MRAESSATTLQAHKIGTDMERVLLTGTNELLTKHFMAVYEGVYDMRLLSKFPSQDNHFYWDPLRDELDPKALEGVDHILHIAGSSYTPTTLDIRSKYLLNTYRSDGTALIGRMLMALGLEVKTFVTASSTTFYGSSYDPYIHTEASTPGKDFLANLHAEGEEEAYILEIESLTKRSVSVRFGNVLCHYGGILPHIALGSNKGLAIIYGMGDQIIPWVHISDAVRTLRYIIENKEMYGPYNCTAPEWVSYKKLTGTAAHVRTGKSVPIHLPKMVLRLMRGELANPFLNSNRVTSHHLIDSGFRFLYPDIQSALHSIYDIQ